MGLYFMTNPWLELVKDVVFDVHSRTQIRVATLLLHIILLVTSVRE